MNPRILAMCATSFALGVITHATLTEADGGDRKSHATDPVKTTGRLVPLDRADQARFAESRITGHAESRVSTETHSDSDQNSGSSAEHVKLASAELTTGSPPSALTDDEFKRKSRLAEIAKNRRQMDDAVKNGYPHYAMWAAIRLYKLDPSEDLLIEIRGIAEDIYAKANQFERDGNILDAGDYLETLRWGYINTLKQPFDLDDIAGRHDTIRENPEYFEKMQSRADKLFESVKGQPAKYPPFWDYFELAQTKRKKLKSPEFRANFVRTLKHMVDHHRLTGNYEGLESATRAFRQTFPELMDNQTVNRILKDAK